jgi:hypothetical protein
MAVIYHFFCRYAQLPSELMLSVQVSAAIKYIQALSKLPACRKLLLIHCINGAHDCFHS